MESVNQNDEVTKLYGEFLIRFEYVCHAIRFGILYIIFPDHNDKQVRQNEILTENLTADQLRKKYMALICDEVQTNTDVFKLAQTFSKTFEKLIPLRNSFAHGTSFIGQNKFVKDADEGLLLLRHPKLTKSGLDLNFKKYEIETLKYAITIFEKLHWAVTILTVLIAKKQPPKDYEPRFLETKRLELIEMETKLNSLLKKQ